MAGEYLMQALSCAFPFFGLEDRIRRRHNFENIQGHIVAPGENLGVEDVDAVQGKDARNP